MLCVYAAAVLNIEGTLHLIRRIFFPTFLHFYLKNSFIGF